MSLESINPTVLTLDQLVHVCATALEHIGVSRLDATLVSELLVQSEAEGALSHGVSRLPMLLRRIQAGSVKPRTPMTPVRDSLTTALLDAQDGIGQVAAIRGMEAAVKKAASMGLGAVTVVNGGNFGRAGHPALIAANSGMIGIAASNASPRVISGEGMRPVLGNNPWAVAIPTAGDPVVIDMANSIVAAGKIRAAKADGRPIPEGWATDSSGRWTTDPGEALTGALMAFGGYKGWSLSLIVDMLTGVLSGGTYGDDVGPPDDLQTPQRSAFFFLAIRIENYLPIDEFKRRADDLVCRLKASSESDVRIPGENSAQNRRKAATEGIKLRPSTASSLDVALREIGLNGWQSLVNKT
ncbi:Ldh family oxidoreductase [Aurantimonas sp. C2-6-R+9]|uniref:Ldh family oxidoreductase n=1 Tax=unclassified Aurantimonas TaxID=2638230 RepID=UPI002E18F850|nr:MULTISPECIES: Ldh family oxidoreductase [unclassified Aurantimonas]MEC5293129.1 Ldh family oxidoreductase [Aurantimonas sp. C2-3-R2]MEC5383219.1 Ldh family oxidoreductase [Aurantimonas sp. C2-6-R+9]MEC5414203.1 Ldh family oxidoreductase [Aurantimonas sp. C2-4-R8]